MIVVFFDGLNEPCNPNGVACYGTVVYDGLNEIYCESGVVGAGMFGEHTTNNIAEYTGMLRGLEWLIESKLTERPVDVRGDSQLVIRQMNGEYSVKSPTLINLYSAAKACQRRFHKITFTWIPREDNVEADTLTRKAYREFALRNLRSFRSFYSKHLATERQLNLIERLGGQVDPTLSRSQASKVIKSLLKKGAAPSMV